MDLPRVRLDGGARAFRQRWGYELSPPPTLLEEDEGDDGEDAESHPPSETTSLRDEGLLMGNGYGNGGHQGNTCTSPLG